MPLPLAAVQAALPGRYRVEREIGHGGMATVYLARELDLDRPVAVKVLPPELAAILGRERFLAEIRLTARLQHPNILPVLASGEGADCLWYIAPFIEGESLRQKLTREQLLPAGEAIAIARQVGAALDHAHRAGIIHRDIKPENILLHDGHAVLADFGIALAVQEAGGQRLTETGLSVGTPQYMSPEQATGDRGLDARSDVYALAAVIYEMLAGEPPHSGATAQAVIAKLMTTEPVPLAVLRPALPRALDGALARGLAKVREDRCASAGELIAAMETAMTAGAPVVRRPRVGLPARLTLFGAVAGLSFLLWRWRSGTPASSSAPDQARRVAVLYFTPRGENDSLALLADGLTEGLISRLSQVPEIQMVSRNGSAEFRDLVAPPESIGRILQAGTVVGGEVEPTGDGVRLTLRMTDVASGTEFQRASIVQPGSAYLAMTDSLAQLAAYYLRERFGVELRLRRERSRAKNTDAWLTYRRADRLLQEARRTAASEPPLAERKLVEADSFARLARRQDPGWNGPLFLRASIAYQRSRQALGNPSLATEAIALGMSLIDSALAREDEDPDALELRGNLQYWKYLLQLEPDSTRAAQLRGRARADLEEATRIRPSQAGAWASLSHLYGNDPGGGPEKVVQAALRAYEEDAFLTNAPKIIERLFLAYFDLDRPVYARRWCEEGHRRFPGMIPFTTCQLYLMTMNGVPAHPDTAWRLARSDVLAAGTDFDRAEATMLVAGTLARAGLKDSARAVAHRAEVGADIDPTRFIPYTEAWVLALADDTAGSIDALRSFLSANPGRRSEFAGDPGWKFRSLVGDPRFQALINAK